MITNKASITMQAVCAARASLPQLVLLDPSCEKISQQLPESAEYKAALDKYSHGWFTKTVQMRTLYFSNILDRTANDYKQIIVPSFGLDFRTLYHPYWQHKPKFLLDHPASLQISKKIFDTIIPDKSTTVLLPFDLTDLDMNEFESCLKNSGFVSGYKTLLLWEGSSYYFSQDSVLQILSMFKRLALDIRIAFDYVNKENLDKVMVDDQTKDNSLNKSLQFIKERNEQWKSAFTKDEMIDSLNSIGFSNIVFKSDMQLQKEIFNFTDPDYKSLFSFVDAY